MHLCFNFFRSKQGAWQFDTKCLYCLLIVVSWIRVRTLQPYGLHLHTSLSFHVLLYDHSHWKLARYNRHLRCILCISEFFGGHLQSLWMCHSALRIRFCLSRCTCLLTGHWSFCPFPTTYAIYVSSRRSMYQHPFTAYVCTHVYMYVYIYNMYMYVCMYVYIHVYVHIHVHIHIHIHIHVHIHIHLQSMYICTYTYIYIYIYIYIQIIHSIIYFGAAYVSFSTSTYELVRVWL